jgi:hypothetical protein
MSCIQLHQTGAVAPGIEDKVKSLAATANQGSGLVFEIFVQRFSRMFDAEFPLGSKDREQALVFANGAYATPEELAQTQDEYRATGCCAHGLDPDCCPCGCGDLDTPEDIAHAQDDYQAGLDPDCCSCGGGDLEP